MSMANTQKNKCSDSSVCKGILSGIKRALPIVMGYLPVSFTFGILAGKAGLGPLDALFMGALFFAGAGQLIAVDMLLHGNAFTAIVVTTTIVNLRHLLMSAAMVPPLREWSRLRKALFAYQMTDETFALHSSRFANMANPHEDLKKPFYIAETYAINVTSHLSWISGGVLGAWLGDILGNLQRFGLDYALPAMFVALLAPRLKDRSQLIVAGVAGVASVLFVVEGMSKWNIILSSVIAATIGVFIPKKEAGL